MRTFANNQRHAAPSLLFVVLCSSRLLTAAAADDSHQKSRLVLELFVAAIVPFGLRLLQSIGQDLAYACFKQKAFGGQDPLQEALLPANKELLGSEKVEMYAIMSGYSGDAGWQKAVEELGYHKNTARAVAGIRLVFWHLMQPAMYFWVFYSFADEIDETQYKMGAAVAVREATYVLLVAYGIFTAPAFLLVNVHYRFL